MLTPSPSCSCITNGEVTSHQRQLLVATSIPYLPTESSTCSHSVDEETEAQNDHLYKQLLGSTRLRVLLMLAHYILE